MKRVLLAAALLLTLSVGGAACGGDDDNDANGTPTAATTGTRTASGTASANASPGTPAPVVTSAPVATLSPEEATRVAGDITGGSPDASPVIVSTIPAVVPPAGTTPVIDPTQIAPPNAQVSGIEMIVDMNASEAGIQSSRDVNPGDVFKVAIVVTNFPAFENDIGGLTALNFVLDYDKTKIVAPTISGGSVTDRNPDLNVADLGGDAAGWNCLPAPEGDRDDPGGIDGDGNPATGQALLVCFTPGTGRESGTLVIATVTFTAIASGSSALTLNNVEVADALGIGYAHCAEAQIEPIVPCRDGTVNVR